jgi:Flp pilus assembly protein TadD
MRHFEGLSAILLAAIILAGCQNGTGALDLASTASVEPARTALQSGKLSYRNEDYGLAQQHFLKATEEEPFNPEAWMGLAAAYDRIGRFDLADRAYTQAESLIGPAPQLLNNRGYSYMLRGDTEKARTLLGRAQAALPQNETVDGNARLLQAM